MFKVVEKFVSINGEGLRQGQLAVFIRFASCNLQCSYCDTAWANEQNVPFEYMSCDNIYEYIKQTGVKNVTLTGGEPLLQVDMIELLEFLSKDNTISIEIETNGSVDVSAFLHIKNVIFTMDYKLPSSNMEQQMKLSNFAYVTKKDVIKFVVGNMEDLYKMKNIIDKHVLQSKVNIYISPVFGGIDLSSIVDFMKENNLIDINFQIQMHKVIWGNKKGV